MAGKLAIVSASDSQFFDLLQGLIWSIRDKPQGHTVDLCVFDIGLTKSQREWLMVHEVSLKEPEWPFDVDVPKHVHAFVERSRVQHYFPDYDVYMWIDADAWVQSWSAIEVYFEAASRTGFCAVPENDRSYDASKVFRVHENTFSQFGQEAVDRLKFQAPVNAGVFAGRADAPHWTAWRDIIAKNIGQASDIFLFDQTALNIALDGLPHTRLEAKFNWVCFHCLPQVAADDGYFVEPNPPHDTLGIIHAAGYTKRRFFQMDRVGGGTVSRTVSYVAHSMLPPGDYVSPDFAVVMPDLAFPNMVLGDRNACPWAFLRREIPHNWYVDRRIPTWGFVSRDEAHILYNTALAFRGKRVLEIGCLMGWSACHLALAGIDLDIIDPLLSDEVVGGSVRDSLSACMPSGKVMLASGSSPVAVHSLAKDRAGWSLFFIDGDHEGDAPLNDTIACEQYAAPDAAMLFHDLAAPAVAAGLHYLHKRGWKVRIYHTAQIMGIAWRGNVEPVYHLPDPSVTWTIPDHLLPLLSDPLPNSERQLEHASMSGAD